MGEQPIELHPTYRGLVDLLKFVGFSELILMRRQIEPEILQTSKEWFIDGHLRRIIIAFK